jgi:hypothetical protein
MAVDVDVDVAANILVDMVTDMDVDVAADMDDGGPCIYGPISNDHFGPTNYFISNHFQNSTNFENLVHF